MPNICNCQMFPGRRIYFFPAGQGRPSDNFPKIVLGQKAVKHVKFHPVAGQWAPQSPHLQEEAEGYDNLLRYVTDRELGHPANYAFPLYRTSNVFIV